MTRLLSATARSVPALAAVLLFALAFALPLSAGAEPDPERAPEGALIRASVDALPLPVAAPDRDRTEDAREDRSRTVPRGSSQSAAGYRFTSPYAFPLQTLPIQFPTLAPVNF